MINLVAPINKVSYGYVASEILYYLSKKTEVALFPISVDPDEKYVSVYNKGIANQERWSHKNPSLRIFHEFDLALHAGNPRIAYPFFEIDTLDPRRVNHLSNQDLVIVASKWAQDILSKYKIASEVIPLGINEEILLADKTPAKVNKCIFMTIGKWETRKGHDVLHKIFKAAFPKEQDVELWCFAYNPFLSSEEKQRWENNYRVELGNRVKFFPRVSNLTQYIQMAHCGIFLSRAEGWNLGLLEMMAMGKYVITTNCSAHTEFCNNDNSNIVQIDELEPAYDGKWFFNTGNWAKLGKNQIDQSIEYLRKAYGLFYENKRVNEAGIETGKQFTFENTTEKLYGVIKSISKDC